MASVWIDGPRQHNGHPAGNWLHSCLWVFVGADNTPPHWYDGVSKGKKGEHLGEIYEFVSDAFGEKASFCYASVTNRCGADSMTQLCPVLALLFDCLKIPHSLSVWNDWCNLPSGNTDNIDHYDYLRNIRSMWTPSRPGVGVILTTRQFPGWPGCLTCCLFVKIWQLFNTKRCKKLKQE